jgi:hypothetical protein
MATCDLMDSIHMEVLGQATFQNALIDHITMEVLGFFQFGSINVDHITMETIGQMPAFAFMDHIAFEILGVASGCPSCD